MTETGNAKLQPHWVHSARS